MEGFSKGSVPAELNAYVGLPDSSFAWEVAEQTGANVILRLKAQTWRDIQWVHGLAVIQNLPPTPPSTDTAVLYITGGDPNPLDLADAATLTAISGLPTAMLFNMPNQPLFGKEEDELIAHTFDRFLDSEDASWPLLFPMAKSVISAMDVLEAWSDGRLKRFVLMGESKRAWAAWMAAATGDPRIIGIAPAAFDNLNMGAQIAYQLDLWDSLSPAIHDYTDLGLHIRIDSEAGNRLARMVDPYSYLASVKTRVLLVHGANDPYWAPDALTFYIEALPGGTTLLTLPNEGHVFADKSVYYATAGAFARSCALNTGWPTLFNKLDELNNLLVKPIISADCPAVCTSCRLFVAYSENGDFSVSEWRVESQCSLVGSVEVRYFLPEFEPEFQAAFVQADVEMELGGRSANFKLSTPTVLRRRSASF